jgi:glucokinase
MSVPELGLIGDIGATNARFALIQADGSMTPPRVHALNDYPSISHAIDGYLAEESPPARPASRIGGCLAHNGRPGHAHKPYLDVLHRGTPPARRPQATSRDQRLCRQRARNPHLGESDRVQIGAGSPVNDAPIALIGPGTGLGVSALIPTQSGVVPISGEGEHVTMAPANARESAVLDLMCKRCDHVSAERVLSGPGLVNLYATLCELSAVPAASFMPAQITSMIRWRILAFSVPSLRVRS